MPTSAGICKPKPAEILILFLRNGDLLDFRPFTIIPPCFGKIIINEANNFLELQFGARHERNTIAYSINP